MNADRLIDSLERFADVFPVLAAQVPEEDRRWRPPGEKGGGWSVLEILGHLADEEVHDFRPRIEATLAGRDWEPIDPEGWVHERAYDEADWDATLARFVTERRDSVAWLRGLGVVRWEASHEHAELGTLRAGDLLAAWVAHDALHGRQILRRAYERTVRDAGVFDTRYAGPGL